MSKRAVEYQLEEQIGFILRVVGQRHSNIFHSSINEKLTPTQFSVLVKLNEIGKCSQNFLGRETAMDIATINGVVERLKKRGFIRTFKDPNDKRRLLIELTDGKVVREALIRGNQITKDTLSPLNKTEQKTLLKLLKRLR